MRQGDRGPFFGSSVRRRTAIAVVIATAALGILAGLAIHRDSSATSGLQQLSELRGEAVWPAGKRPAPDFALPDQEGRRFELTGLRGRPVILTFMDSRCHQECPLEGHALAAGLRTVPPAEQPAIVVVSVDPWEDTPASAKRAIRRFGLAAYRWRWLLAPRKKLEAVWRKYRIEVRRTPSDIEHTDALYLIDAHGFERGGMVYPFLPTWISDDLGTLAQEG
jgi:protein SCO1